MTTGETLVILDFGSQYTQFIARSARELGVYSVVLPFNAPLAEIKSYKPRGIVLSGGPSSVYDKDAPRLNTDILELGVPILGVCYGLQLLAQHFGGKVDASNVREYGRANIKLTAPSRLINREADGSVVWMSHGDHVVRLPASFTITAKSGNLIAAAEDAKQNLYGVQFHMEVAQSEYGQAMFKNFLELCDFNFNWQPASLINTEATAIRQLVGIVANDIITISL